MPANESIKERRYDVVVWGASGFTGRLVVEYLARKYPQGEALRWAIAGRSQARLEEILDAISFAGAKPDVVVADSHDQESLLHLASSTRVVLTTVGPYAKYGSGLVAACVASGTDYCDLCGEVQWMRQMIEQHQADAEKSGARIVMSCGFDSIPSDIGTDCLQELAQKQHGTPCNEVNLLVRAMKGGASGGTFASMLHAIEQARRDRNVARILADPYALNPDGERQGPDGRDQAGSRFDADAGLWTAPFVMASVNTRVVRRSNALRGYPYGRNFRYSEATMTGSGLAGRLRAMLGSAVLRLFMVASAFDFSRQHLVRRLIPKPGQGPTREQRENGYFNLLLLGKLPGGALMRLRVKGDRDPGYGSTSKMLAESAVCLARDNLVIGGGIWTPASAMGKTLRNRLVRNAGLSFDAE